MYKKNINNNIIIILSSTILLIILLLTSFNMKAYDLGTYEELHEEMWIYDHFNRSLADEKSSELISFFKTGSSLDDSFYTQEEISHLKDVKKIFVFLKILNWILIILFITGLVYLYHQGNFLKDLIKIILIQLIVCIVLLLLFYILPFDLLFEKMHKLFFPQGNYSFDSSSNLINLFPIGFFAGFTDEILKGFFAYELIVLGGALVLFIGNNRKLFKKIFK